MVNWTIKHIMSIELIQYIMIFVYYLSLHHFNLFFQQLKIMN